jgi:radical SAM superfamily enzyme YgiQ (UPF0313 family)
MIQRERFPITLVFPPQGHFTQPYLALPCIKAWLVAHGFEDVELVDANIEAYDRFLSSEYLSFAADRVRARLPLERFESLSELPFRDLAAFRAAAESAVSAGALIDRIEDAKRVLRGGAFFDVERYVPAVRTIYHALRLVSAAHFPSALTPHNFTMRYSIDRSAEVLAATIDEDENPFVEHFRDHLLPRLVARRPRLVGLSVIYGSQLVPALTLARMIKQALPDCHVTAGGGFLAYIGEKLMKAPGIDRCLDSLVFHEGEMPTLELAQALRDGTGLGSIGSLAWFDRTHARGEDRPSARDLAHEGTESHDNLGERGASGVARQGTESHALGEHGARAVFGSPGHPIKLDDAPIPDFGGLPLDKYFSPELVIPYDINRGCYYGECTFCTLPTVIGPGYRTRRASTIVDHIAHLSRELGTRNVNFITDCMPPGMIRDLPGELVAKNAHIRWWCDARVEPKAYTKEGAELLYRSGCRKLLFGFETATPRLLKMMMKGQSLKSTVDVARNCAAAGISVTFYAMVGFPSETREEARATLDFLVEHKDIVREVSLQTFHIDEVAQTYRRPGDFGITIIDDPSADIELYHDYTSEQGMTETEAAEMFEEMMAGLRASYPLFGGDNIYYFMQKSHYFLHLARDVKPADFVERCRARSERRARLGAEPSLAPREAIASIEIPFGYTDALEKLAHPLARAVRPDFLTGRYVAGAEAAAERALGAIPRKRRALLYEGESAEFVELAPDGLSALDALRGAGSLRALLATLAPEDEASRAKLEAFAAGLHRAGLLAPSAKKRASVARS